MFTPFADTDIILFYCYFAAVQLNILQRRNRGKKQSKYRSTVIHFEALVEITKIYSITNRRF